MKILECFQKGKNSFEQICINFVNEKIRQFSTKRLIKDELYWYAQEGISVPHIDLLDNANIIGIFSYYDTSECQQCIVY